MLHVGLHLGISVQTYNITVTFSEGKVSAARQRHEDFWMLPQTSRKLTIRFDFCVSFFFDAPSAANEPATRSSSSAGHLIRGSFAAVRQLMLLLLLLLLLTMLWQLTTERLSDGNLRYATRRQRYRCVGWAVSSATTRPPSDERPLATANESSAHASTYSRS